MHAFTNRTFTSKAAAVAAIKAEGFTMERNTSGKGDKEVAVSEGEFPGVYNHFARPVEDGSTGIWYVLVDINRMGDLPEVAPVAKAETVRFSHVDINACRKWLRDNGLTCFATTGWQSSDNAARLGLIDFYKGEWHAAIIANPNR